MPGDPESPWPLVISQAWQSYVSGGWGIGAVAVGADGAVLAEGMNAVRTVKGPDSAVSLRHAEIVLLEALGRAQLPRCRVFCSVEPCVLCLGALMLCRVPAFTFAARDLSFTPAVRHLRQAPVLGSRVPDAQGPELNRFGVFTRLLSMVAEVDHSLGRGTFGLERRLTPRLVGLAERCVRERTFKRAADRAGSPEGGWRPLLDAMSPLLADCVPEVTRLEERLRKLGMA